MYLQKPDGTVLWRENGYPGPGALATALRRTRPDYDPNKDQPMVPPRRRWASAGVPPDAVYGGLFFLAVSASCGTSRGRSAEPGPRPRTGGDP
jgi:hypothetical protein